MSQRICVFVILALMCTLAAATFAGRVVGVHDGDTLTLLTASKESVSIRLAEIDAPESGQPYGQRAKQALSALAFGQPARVVVQDIDRYGRTIGLKGYNDLARRKPKTWLR